jgi:hypothetical protein
MSADIDDEATFRNINTTDDLENPHFSTDTGTAPFQRLFIDFLSVLSSTLKRHFESVQASYRFNNSSALQYSRAHSI